MFVSVVIFVLVFFCEFVCECFIVLYLKARRIFTSELNNEFTLAACHVIFCNNFFIENNDFYNPINLFYVLFIS